MLLFDEPLSNLDAKLRDHLREDLRALQQKLGTTSLYVTHDQAEAMALADLMHAEGRTAERTDPLAPKPPHWRIDRAALDKLAGQDFDAIREEDSIVILGNRALAGEDGLGEVIGRVTSGTKSPTLGEAIALAYVPKAHSKPGARLAVDVRGKAVIAEVVKGPFYKRSE